MYHKNLLSAPSAQYTRATPLKLTTADGPATFISSAAPFSATLTKGRTYFLNAECDGFMGRWGAAGDGATAKLMRLHLASADGNDVSTSGKPGIFVPKQTGTYYVKVVAEGAGETRSAWNFSVTEAARASEYAPPPDAADAGAGQIKIFSPSGGALGIFPLLEAAVRKTELMGADTVTLQWDDECADDEDALSLPLGSYIVVDGVKFRLIAPYSPQQSNELAWHYEPVFHSPASALTTKPFFFYMEDLCETDFNINGEFKEFTDALAKAILKSTGETWEVSAPADLGTRSVSFSQQTIFGAVGDIADAFGCEWTAGEAGISFVKDATSEDARTLTVGEDITAPSPSNTEADYFNRYYAFGSTRNIVRSDYSSLNASVTSLSEPRLKLPAKDWVDTDGTAVAGCAGGYVDYDDGAAQTPAERNACVKVYDDIYPRSDLKVASVTATTKRSDDGEEYPVYKLTMETAAGEAFSINTSTYNKESNPDGHLISGLNVSVSFSTGLLQGKEFEVGVSPDGAAFTIVPDTSEEIMVPNNLIVPQAGDACVLFNIRMPDSYREEAEKRLYRKLMEDIEAAHSQYAAVTLTSIAAAGVTGLRVADKIIVRNGRSAVTTRIVSMEQHLDVPSEWSITTGDAVRTSKLRTMQESVAQLSGAAASATRGAARANRAAWKASQELLEQVFDPDGSFFTETIKPLVVQTANVTVGTKSQQFVIDNLLFYFDNGEQSGAAPSFNAVAEKDSVTPRLMHYAIDPDGVRTWTLNKSYRLAYGQPSTTLGAAFSFGSSTPGCYIYAVCAKFKEGSDPSEELNGQIVLTDRQVLAEPAEDTANYWFLLGMLSSEIVTDGVVSRSVTLTFGETTINGRHIKTGRIESVDSSTGIDLDKGVIFGNIQLASSASDDANKQFIDSLLGYSTGKAAMEGDIAAATNAAATAIASASSAQSAASAANDKVDNLKVGGRNYLLKTGAAWSVPGKGSGASENYTVYNYKASSDEAFKKGVTATISFDYDNGVTGGAANILVHNMWSLLIALTPSNTGSGRFSKTLALTADVALSHPIYIQGKWDGSFTISNAKWETGNVPTSWTPAPEDVDEAIEAAKAAAVEEVDVMYAIGASSTTAPTSGWQTAAPAWEGGKYMWQRTDITTGDGVRHTGTPTCIQGAAGATGAAGRGIKGVQEQYYLSTSKTAQEGGSWQTAQPTWSAGKYVWTRSLITYSDGTTGYSAATLSELFNKANETAASAQTTAATAKDAVDNMEVGGRNYILKTSTPSVYKSVTTSQFVTRLGMISAGLAQRQVAMGEHITVSFEFRTDGKVDGGGSQWIVINGSGQWRTLGYTAQFEDTAGAWVRREHTWKWGDSFSQSIKDAPKDLTVDDEFVIGCNPSSSVVNIEIRRLKLEVGNKRTDWAPAPEDTDAAIDKALALTGDPDNLFSDQFLFNLSNSTAVTPPKGKARLCNNRDNVFGNEIAVTPGAKVTIEAVLLRHPSDTSGIPPRFGLWYTDTDDGVDAYVDYSLATDIGAVGMTDDWHKWRRVFTVPSGVRKGRFFLQINNYANGDNTQGAFYASSVVVKMETRDYLREALEEASSGTTDVSGGLVLSTMMSVRDAGGVMVAGMSGAAAAAETGALPMIWAGADENSTAGIGAADFRVYKDGGIVMHSAQILGKAGEPAVTVSKGNISVGTMNDAGDGLASVGTEIIPDSYASVAAVLNGLAGSGGTLGGTNTYTKTLTVGTHTLNTAGLAVRLYGTTVTTTLCGGTTEAAGTIWAGFTAGTYRLAGKVTAYSGANDKRLLMASLTFSFRVYLKVGESYVQIASGDGMDRQTNSGTSATTLTLTMSESGSLSTATKSLPFSKGQAWSVVVAADYTVESIYYAILPPTTLNVATSPSVTLSSATLKVSDVQAAYRNKIFRNGLVMSKSNANYLVVASDSSSPLVEARAGTSTTANAGVRLAAGGLQVNYDGTASSAWHEAFPLYAVVKLTHSSATALSEKQYLYNPHNLGALTWNRTTTGVFTIGWTSPAVTLYPLCMVCCTEQRYATLRSLTTTSITVATSDDNSTNDLLSGSYMLIYLFKF